MRVYILSEEGDPHGMLRETLRQLRLLPIRPAIFLTDNKYVLGTEYINDNETPPEKDMNSIDSP